MSIRSLKKEENVNKSLNIRFPLRRSAHGAFDLNKTTLDAVRDDLKSLIITNWGERIIHYDFGANLRSIIFEQGEDVKQKIEDAINTAIEKWMPFVNVVDIQTKNQKDDPGLGDYEISLKIIFQVGSTGLEGQLDTKVSAQ